MRPFAAILVASVVSVGVALPPVRALVPVGHDPRTTAKKLSQGLEVEGAGKLALDYKALHFNKEMFDRARNRADFMDFLNAEVWGRMGKATVGFELVSGSVSLAPGDYDFGINMTPAEEFSIVFWRGQEKKELKLEVERDQKPVPYLSITLMATDAADTFTLEARCGPYRGTVGVKVPYLSEDHGHPR